MSVVEFSIAGLAAIPLFCASHELGRVLLVRHSVQLVLEATVAKVALGSLEYIAKDTFSNPGVENDVDRMLKKSIRTLLTSPLLSWSFFNMSNEVTSLSLDGIRASVTGPTSAFPRRVVQAKLHLCLRTWLKPLAQFVSEERNCLGQFKNQSSQKNNPLQGMTLHFLAVQEIPLSVEIYLARPATVTE